MLVLDADRVPTDDLLDEIEPVLVLEELADRV